MPQFITHLDFSARLFRAGVIATTLMMPTVAAFSNEVSKSITSGNNSKPDSSQSNINTKPQIAPKVMPISMVQKQAYSPQRFAQLQQANAVILIDVYAPWCSTCAKQQALLNQLALQNPKLKLHILQVSYDHDTAALQRFKIPRQSTMLLFKGEKQLWFSVAETRYQVIYAAVQRAFAL